MLEVEKCYTCNTNVFYACDAVQNLWNYLHNRIFILKYSDRDNLDEQKHKMSD